MILLNLKFKPVNCLFVCFFFSYFGRGMHAAAWAWPADRTGGLSLHVETLAVCTLIGLNCKWHVNQQVVLKSYISTLLSQAYDTIIVL